MKHVVFDAFNDSIETFRVEQELMPFDRWNESVLRYFFCRAIAAAHPTVTQRVECGRIDLVLTDGKLRAFIEFKFYASRISHDPYGLHRRGFKGGPGARNLSEFIKCVQDLHIRPTVAGLSKYLVLVYGDADDVVKVERRYASHYDDYKHPNPDVAIQTLASSAPILTGKEVVRFRLYEVAAAQERAPQDVG